MDSRALRAIAGLTDPVGVLSVYVSADPHDGVATHPARQVRIANELSALDRRLRKDGDAVRADRLLLRLADIHRQVEDLLDPATPGRGRALFVPLAGEAVHAVAVQVPLPDHVDLGPAAQVRPLLTALGGHPPCGVAAVGGHGVHLVDVRLGRATDAGSDAYEPGGVDRRDLTGPAAPDPALAQHTSAQHDLFTRREAERLDRFLRGAAVRAGLRARELGWEFLVVTGDPARAAAFVAGLPREPAIPTVTADHRVGGLTAARIHAALDRELTELRHRYARDLVRSTVDRALGGGAGAYGLADTLTALAEGRILHLLVDASREWTGRVGPDGRLYPELVGVPGVPDAALRPEPHLGERMASAVLRRGGRVTVLDPADAAGLGGADGVAAVLRW